MPLTRGSKTIYVNLSPEVIDFILQTIQDFADEGTENFIDRLESRLNEITVSNEDAKTGFNPSMDLKFRCLAGVVIDDNKKD